MSENKNNLAENISVDDHSADNVVYGETIDLEKLAEEVQEEKISKGKYDGKLPLVKSAKEAKKFMDGLLADDARAAGTDALVVGASINRQYNTMKRLAYWLSGLAVVSSVMSGYLIYDQQQQVDNYDILLRQTVSALPKEQIQYARSVYAGAIIDHMNKNPDMGVLEATEASVQYINAQKNDGILPSVKHVISNDLMTLAQSYEDIEGPRHNYLSVMAGYTKNNVPVYTNRHSSQELIKGQLFNYLQNAHAR
ncbi:MAG: hypothetical protein IKL32_06140 [Alphaproteobacteria bacterium]|nr:hypothetical protein [Alphaproteobacteria bacterium]